MKQAARQAEKEEEKLQRAKLRESKRELEVCKQLSRSFENVSTLADVHPEANDRLETAVKTIGNWQRGRSLSVNKGEPKVQVYGGVRRHTMAGAYKKGEFAPLQAPAAGVVEDGMGKGKFVKRQKGCALM
eukprot:comp9734_c0_seq2/m.4705 comp9734_c0_seq2/g.4705  ORF comp9734_c0_seq2/g.4705 comp9734_c0_seq2/m.4705 type:complete len:130 (-) comp9734_c0_seq2:91-480(-)